MKALGEPSNLDLADSLIALGILIGIAYAYCMFVSPWFDGCWSWDYVQATWERWQALNVGMLAFLSSIIAFRISRYRDRAQRERDFTAEKAFLPESLASLSHYFKDCSKLLREAWNRDEADRSPYLKPTLPEGYREVFKQCIRFAPPRVGEYLADVLRWLQVNDSRLKSLVEELEKNGNPKSNRHNIFVYFYRLGELQASLSRLFPFARGEEDLNIDPLDWDDFQNAYVNLDILFPEDLELINDNLKAFTERQIKRETKLEEE